MYAFSNLFKSTCRIVAVPSSENTEGKAFLTLAPVSVFLLLTSTFTASGQSCSSLMGEPTATSFFAEQLGSASCEVVRTNRDGGPPAVGQHTIIVPTGWMDTLQEKRTAYVNEIWYAIATSIERFEELGLFPGRRTLNTVVLLGVEEIVPLDASAAVPDHLPNYFLGSTCPMLFNFFENLPDATGEQIRFITAHELYHCYAIQSYGNELSDVDKWWMEGVANFFAHSVEPSSDVEHSHASLFDPSLRIYEHQVGLLPYSTVAFLLFLESRGQREAIFSQYNNLPAYPRSPNDFQDMLSEWPDIDNLFHEFARTFFGEKFPEISGSLVPTETSESAPANLSFDQTHSTAHWTYEPHPFVIEGNSIFLEAGQTYNFTFREEGEHSKISTRLDDGEWMDPMATITTPCDTEQELLVLVTNTSHSSAGLTPFELKIDMEWEPSAECGCSYEPVTTEMIAANAAPEGTEEAFDRCLIGNWRLNSGSYSRQLTRLSPPGATVQAAHATGRISVTSDGISDACLSASFQMSLRHGGQSATISGTTKASATHRLTVTSPGKLASNEVSSKSETQTVVVAGGHTNRNTVRGRTQLFTLLGEYSCSESTLRLRSFPPDVDYIEHTYRRVD